MLLLKSEPSPITAIAIDPVGIFYSTHQNVKFFMNTVKGYETVNQDSGEVIFEDASAKYALFPLWLLSAEWNGNIYRFAMNGQTGKFVGDLPMDGKAYALWMFLLTLGFSALAFLISFLLFN